MLSRFFNPDNVVWRFFTMVGYIWILHILWLVCSLPVVTAGASATALMYSCIKLHRGEGSPVKNFFKSFKENFKQATAMFFIFLVIGLILAGDFIVAGATKNLQMRTFFRIIAGVISVPYILSLLYSFSVLAWFKNSVADTIKYSFMLSIKHFAQSFQILALLAVVTYANMQLTLFDYITISFGIGFIAYFITAYHNKVFRLYEPVSETIESNE
jgi:uncharacterized membrane protein YesL